MGAALVNTGESVSNGSLQEVQTPLEIHTSGFLLEGLDLCHGGKGQFKSPTPPRICENSPQSFGWSFLRLAAAITQQPYPSSQD